MAARNRIRTCYVCLRVLGDKLPQATLSPDVPQCVECAPQEGDVVKDAAPANPATSPALGGVPDAATVLEVACSDEFMTQLNWLASTKNLTLYDTLEYALQWAVANTPNVGSSSDVGP